ncbi:MAG: bifunctional riboflavin kinase/FAD synthetase [Gammaproteobacteria bacterium]|nr:bifunctional riboflavin kinase/FAD synthetase [Gammaproteobacteria bacterium]NNF48694.1 bifunctional riboflavin kinase/FAD synthetase [Woeseiaceae bacterium]MBT8093657.1 bifunctional riboflavin kinase/FAD synthetase [Gammaproteobacteria bacterium]MBT8106290.1 bifunctional riboflavin kinase/FAD synthetase [Gammaproteobacteria bacterium]NNK26304.1 bifunctional riboflavin kinase/FAD synthetase [Woeseiaceae bacterium]
MRLVRHLADLPHSELARGSVLTIGAFDGIHLGHRQLLRRVVDVAIQSKRPAIVMSFEPMPKEFFLGDSAPARLMRFREKHEALAERRIELFFCPRFDAQMREISAATFVRQILVHGLNARHVVVGDDFRFARRREGSLADLLRVSEALDLTVEQVPSILVGDTRVSSTAIREALARGDMARATAFLGRPYRMSGRIVRGREVGRQLGYPTANVDLRRRQSPVMGIYAVRVHGLPEGPVDGVASVGTRPTFDLTKPLLEVHLFDFSREIYGEYIHVDFIEHLRDEEKFASIDDLVAQMKTDEQNARSALASGAA